MAQLFQLFLTAMLNAQGMEGDNHHSCSSLYQSLECFQACGTYLHSAQMHGEERVGLFDLSSVVRSAGLICLGLYLLISRFLSTLHW